jgi:hypothetical protein
LPPTISAAAPLFASGDEPAFFFAITLHTLELASPAVASWNKPVILYSVVPEADRDKELRPKSSTSARNKRRAIS